MKKAIAFSMAAIMLLSMAGCSKDSKKTKSDESAETKTNKESVSGESDGDSKNAKDRYLVCARWNYLREDIINYKKKE